MRAFSRAFLLFLAVLVGAEMVARAFFVRTLSGRFEYGYDATAGFVEQEDGRVDLVRAGGRKFFPQSFSKQRQADTFRVMVIGDSVPRGKDVASSYAGQLGRLLAEADIRAESINLCLPGYGARRKQVVLQQAVRYQPSVVILHVNASNEYEDEREWRRREEFRSMHPQNWLMKFVVIRRLYEAKNEKLFWELLPAEIRSQNAVSDADAEVAASLNDGMRQQWRQRVREVTQTSVETARAAGVPLLLVSHAVRSKSPDGSAVPDDQGQDAWLMRLAGDGVAVLSMKQALIGADLEAVYSDGSHMRAAGHEHVAKAIFETLKQQGWLSSAPAR